MRVSIWDMDFYYKKSFLPNPIAMKLSSFHKQKGDLVNFVTQSYHVGMSYDLYYIIKEKEATPKVEGKFIDDNRVKLIGRPLRFFNNYYEIPAIVAATRPDYLLYPEKQRDAYYNANIVQFYHKGVLLEKIQPFENTLPYHKKTLVIDREFWDVEEYKILFCLEKLQENKNIAFQHPISLKTIMENKEIRSRFIALDFSQGTNFKFRNNYGQDFESVQELFGFMRELKDAHSHVKFAHLPVRAVTTDHWEDKNNAMLDLERCLMVADAAKKAKVRVRIVSPVNRFESPFWYYFENLETWTLYFETISYIEFMTRTAAAKNDLHWHQVLNDSTKWNTPNIYFLLRMFTKTDLIKRFGFRRWGDEFLDELMIKYEEINKYRGELFDPEEIE